MSWLRLLVCCCCLRAVGAWALDVQQAVVGPITREPPSAETARAGQNDQRLAGSQPSDGASLVVTTSGTNVSAPGRPSSSSMPADAPSASGLEDHLKEQLE